MAITVQGMDNVMQRLDQIHANIQASLIDALAEAGDLFVSQALASKTYTDRTGNLSASIGRGVVQDGKVVRFGGFGGGIGEKQGIETLEQAASKITGTALIVVAGMHYAIYVNRKGFSVLDGARLDTAAIAETLKRNLLL